MKPWGNVIVVLGLGLAAAGCGFSDGGPDWAKGAVGGSVGSSVGGGGGTVDYLHDVKPLLQGCVGCHSTMATNYPLSSGLADDMADYNATVAQLDTTTPDNSNLLLYASNNGVNHTGGGPWPQGSAEYDLILQWIADGTLFDSGTGGGGGGGGGTFPANPVYADIKVHLQSCATTGCHATATGYRLTLNLTDDAADHASTLNWIDLGAPSNSLLLRKATQQAGHPLKVFDVGSTPYDQLLTWISQGAPLN
ncbi:MAG: hypothetical protein D6731_21510 [Planctomycetota bacterium]|nr:MAG: hypothetical protein D6731_21510 [Planctomycetota bacterium]